MTTGFWVLLIIGGAALASAAIALVALNWGEQVAVPLLSTGLIGFITFTITFAASLKGATDETACVTAVVEDIRDHLPAFLPPDLHSPAAMRASDLSSQGRGLFAFPTGHPDHGKPAAIKESEVDDFYLDLLRYAIIRRLRDQQRIEWAIGTVLTGDGYVTSGSVNQPPKLTDPVNLKGDAALAVLAGSRFAGSTYERFQWENIRLTLPTGADLELRSDPGGEGKGPQTSGLVIRRGGFFTMTITITPMGATGPNVLPAGLQAPPEARKHYRTHQYTVKMRAEFSRLSAGNRRTDENKKWVRWAFRDLESYLGDATRSR